MHYRVPISSILLTLAFVLAWVGVPAQTDSTIVPLVNDTLVAHDERAARKAERNGKDTLDWRQRHSPTKATILSAVIPGAGQIYNRKYWKAPIAWAGLGTCIYFIQDNNREYQRYKDAYLAIVDGDPNTQDEFNGQYSADQVLNVTDTYRRWRDLSYISLGLVYMLNVIDANVDAHFVRFDISRDLSLGVGPSIPLAAQGGAGFSLAITLR